MARKKLKTHYQRLTISHYQWLIPILALLLIFQAIVLVGPSFPFLVGRQQASKTKIVPRESPVKFSFSPKSVYLKEGRMASVDLILVPKREIRLDGVDIILTFDPKILEVTQVDPASLFSFVSQKRGKEREGKISITFLEEKTNGVLVGQEVKLLTLTIKGKAFGTSDLSILSSDEGPTTVIAESMMSRKIAFDRESLRVVIY